MYNLLNNRGRRKKTDLLEEDNSKCLKIFEQHIPNAYEKSWLHFNLK